MQQVKELYGLIGFPLSHSFSQKYFRNKFKTENIANCDYLNFEINNVNKLPDLILKHKNLKGFNVTIPYKIEIINYLDEIDNEAIKIGAINTVKIIRSKSKIILKGYNTDIYGFTETLKSHLKTSHKNALILGSGGASKAVYYALDKLNINAKVVSRQNNINSEFLNYNELTKDIIKKHKIIINATPLGMFPKINEFPQIPYKFINRTHVLYDLIYNPAFTKFLLNGQKKGAKIINGENMLKFQAEKAWKIFNL